MSLHRDMASKERIFYPNRSHAVVITLNSTLAPRIWVEIGFRMSQENNLENREQMETNNENYGWAPQNQC